MIDFNEIKEILQANRLLIEYKIKNNINVKSIFCDSREVEQNSLFFCKGNKFKEEYLAEAIKNGSICYISEK